MYTRFLICTLALLTPAIRLPAQSENAPLLVLPEAKGHRLVLIDPRAKTVVGQIAVPGWPHEVAFSEDGRFAYIPSYSDAIVGMQGTDGQTIDVVDMRTRTLAQTWDLGKPLRPHMPMLGGNGTLLVSTELAEALSIVDPRTGKIVGQIPTEAKESHIFVRTTDGKRIYTANLHAGSISVLNVAKRRLIKVIQVSKLVNRIALAKDEKRLFVTDGDSPNIIVIDTATNEVTGRIPAAASPFSISLTPDGKWLLVGEDLGSKGRLEAIDLADLTVKHSYDVDRLPYGIKVIGNEAFIACYLSGNLDVLNMSAWTLEAPIIGVAHGDGITIWQGLR